MMSSDAKSVAKPDAKPDAAPAVDLGRQVMDRLLLDRSGRLVGKVDDLIFEAPVDASGAVSGEPAVTAILTGPLALASQWGWWATVARFGYWLLRVRDPHPVEIPWSRVERLGVDVHLTLARDDVPGLDEPERSAARLLEHIPGS